MELTPILVLTCRNKYPCYAQTDHENVSYREREREREREGTVSQVLVQKRQREGVSLGEEPNHH